MNIHQNKKLDIYQPISNSIKILYELEILIDAIHDK